MKKHVLFWAALLGAFALQAQQPITGLATCSLQTPATAQKTTTVDTLSQYFDRATGYYTLSADTAGYVLGTGSLTTETAVHFDGLGQTMVTEVIAYFGHKTVMGGSADDVWIKFYSADTDTTPLMTLDSASISVNDLYVNGFATYIPLTGGAVANGDFLISLAYGGIDDTVALVSSSPVGSSPDGMGEMRTRQWTHQAGWVPAMSIWTVSGQDYDADAMLIPVVDYTVGNSPTLSFGSFSLSAPYPNPGQGSMHFPYHLPSEQWVEMQILDAGGRTVLNEAKLQSPGDHTWTPDLSAFPAGIYHLLMRSGEDQVATKFMLQP